MTTIKDSGVIKMDLVGFS